MTSRYQVWIGPLRINRFPMESLTACFKMVVAQAMINQQRRASNMKQERIRVFDAEPGWLHPIYDSKEHQ